MSSSSVVTEGQTVEVVNEIKTPESSETPSMSEWSSLVFDQIRELTVKQSLFQQGLYDPGCGEICAVYLGASDSTVGRHQYFMYPALTDPGIERALLSAVPEKIYAEDGQDLYLDLCKEMNLAPVRMFHRALLSPVVNLRYYGVNSAGIRAMTMALTNNTIVTRLDLTSCRLTHDACYHIGELLGENRTLQELVLDGCKIKSNGLMQLMAKMIKRPIKLLDLSDNELTDEGVKHLSDVLMSRTVIKRLYLRNNGLTAKTGLDLARALESNNTITHLDLSWNSINDKKGLTALLRELGNSKVLMELRMSWNNISIGGVVLWKIFSVPTLKVLDLSDNQLSSEAAKAIAFKLHEAKKLVTLDLSRNPFTPRDAYRMVYTLNREKVKLKNFLLEDVNVSKDFLEMLTEILTKPYRQKTVVKYGTVLHNYTLTMPDMRTIVMKRLEYLTKPKKCKMDIALFFLQAAKEMEFIEPKELYRILKAARAHVDEDLSEEVALAFPGPRSQKGRTISIAKVVEYVKRLWPDKKLPPTPPPEPEPVPEPVLVKKGKEKKKRGARAA